MNTISKIFTAILFLVLINPVIFSQDKAQKIDVLVNKYYDYGQFNGSVLVSENGKILLEKGYGFANIEWKNPNRPDTKFRLGSITKQFTAMLIMQLAEHGKINLDGKVSDYLPYYRKDIGDKVTVHNLLTHTSGIPNLTNDPELMQKMIRNPIGVKELVMNYCSSDLEFEPGSKFNYSNSGYIILGAIIEEISGKKYENLLSENILTPLNMTGTGYDHTSAIIENRASGYDKSIDGFTNTRYMDMSIPFSAGSLYSSADDLFKWDQALYTEKIISKESKEKMFTPFLDNYGYGWHIEDINIGDVKKKIITHSGGIFGFNTIITRFPEDNNCIILLNNFSSGNLDGLSSGISKILYDQEYSMPKRSITEILNKTILTKGMSEAADEFNALKNNQKDYYIDEGEINQLGYNLVNEYKIDEAIEVFKLNVEAFPNSSNVYDSLGEAYMNKGETELAILNYKKSIELNPKNESGIRALSKLQNK
ncbi:MAG: serine hydrolase [Ignavibacteria bacterium]|nr:serine hydrolase [Ignavibacteria bacterium]